MAFCDDVSVVKKSLVGTPVAGMISPAGIRAVSIMVGISQDFLGWSATFCPRRVQYPPFCATGFLGQYSFLPPSASMAGSIPRASRALNTIPVAATGPSAAFALRSDSPSTSTAAATVAALAMMGSNVCLRAFFAAWVFSWFSARFSRILDIISRE